MFHVKQSDMETLKTCPVCHYDQFSPFLLISDFFLTKEDFAVVQCDNCGLKITNPRPGAGEIGRYYQSLDYFSHDTSKKNLTAYLYQLARFFNLRSKYQVVSGVNLLKEKTILDIGCGTGEFLKYCSGKGYLVCGMEPGEKSRETAQKRNGLRVEANLDPYLGEQTQFSVITLWHVLEHIHDLEPELERIKKLIRPGGKLILAIPNCESWDAGHYGKFWGGWDVPRHLYHFSRTTIEQLGKRSGFSLEKILPQKLDAYYVSLLSEKYRTGRSSFVKAIISGMLSNFHARGSEKNYSSLIYIFSL